MEKRSSHPAIGYVSMSLYRTIYGDTVKTYEWLDQQAATKPRPERIRAVPVEKPCTSHKSAGFLVLIDTRSSPLFRTGVSRVEA